VSWTGDEVEVFRGIDVPAQDVTRAFGIQAVPVAPVLRAGETETTSFGGMTKFIVIGIVAVIGFSMYQSWRKPRMPAGIRKSATLVAPLTTGRTGSVGGKLCTLTGQATVEVCRVGAKYDWMEYALDDGSLLVGGMNVGANEWFVFESALPDGELTPQLAATLGAGKTIALGGKTFRVEDLFQYRTATASGFGLLARVGNDRAIVRWTENGVTAYVGRPIPETEVLAAFK
jgi:hypothetical protein